MAPHHLFFLTATTILFLSLPQLTSAASSSSTSSATAAPTSSVITPESSINATIFPGDKNYAYYGCYNETTLINNTAGLRALNGGAMEADDALTAGSCLAFCSANGADTFAGLEYTRECYCAPYLSSLSAKLPDSSCDLACKGNTTQICGGSLTISVYQKRSSKQGAAVRDKRPVVGSILALGVALGVLVGWS